MVDSFQHIDALQAWILQVPLQGTTPECITIREYWQVYIYQVGPIAIIIEDISV